MVKPVFRLERSRTQAALPPSPWTGLPSEPMVSSCGLCYLIWRHHPIYSPEVPASENALRRGFVLLLRTLRRGDPAPANQKAAGKVVITGCF